jgi:hypothetical protein
VLRQGVALHICNPSYSKETDIGKITVQDQPEQKVGKRNLISTSKLGVVMSNCNPSYMGDIGRRIVI